MIQDLPNAMNADEIADRLRLNQLRKRKFHVEPISGVTGEGIEEGFWWILKNVRN